MDVAEGGATSAYSVVLTSEPTADVIITVTTGGQAIVSSPNLTFTAENWLVPQAVMVTAVDDAIYEGAHSDSVMHQVASADPTYNGFTAASVSVSITDDELPPAELITNGGFEDAGTNNKIPAGWTVVNFVGDKRICRPGKQHDGLCAFKFTGSMGEKARLNQTVNLDNITLNKGDSLTLTAFVKGNNPTAKTQFRLIVLYSNGESETAKLVTKRNEAYTQVSAEAVTVADAVLKVKVSIRHKSTAGPVFMDNVSLTHAPLPNRSTNSPDLILPPPTAPDGFRHP